MKTDLEIMIPLTAYVARHTYATIMTQKNMPLMTLKSQLGIQILLPPKIYGFFGIKKFGRDY